METAGFIALKELEKTFFLGENPVPAVRDFNLTVEKGELLCLVGPSGCGKSTPVSYTHLDVYKRQHPP